MCIIWGTDHIQFGSSLSDSLAKFIRSTDHKLFFYGEAYYEISLEYGVDKKISKLEFFDIYEPSMLHIFGYYIQIVTWHAAQQFHTKAGIRIIPKSKVLHIKFPPLLGGVKKRNAIIKTLIACGILFPDFYTKKLKDNNINDIVFDSKKFAKSQYIEIAQTTKILGWNQRKYDDNNIFEYYSLYRYISHARSQAILREHILATLNEALKKQLGDKYGNIVIENLQNSSDINGLYKVLEKGNLEFAEIYKKVA